jgi:hypothetical protein
MDALPVAFNLDLELQRTGYLDPPLYFQQRSRAIVSHQQPNPIQASVFQQQHYESAAFMPHQPRNQAYTGMYYPELNPQQEQLEAAAFAFHQRHRDRNPIQCKSRLDFLISFTVQFYPPPIFFKVVVSRCKSF